MVKSRINMAIHTLARWFAVLTFVVAGIGCAGAPARNALPLELNNEAGIPRCPRSPLLG